MDLYQQLQEVVDMENKEETQKIEEDHDDDDDEEIPELEDAIEEENTRDDHKQKGNE